MAGKHLECKKCFSLWFSETTFCKKNMADVGRSRGIHWLCKLLGNFHSSAVFLYLCVQEESHGRRMPHPPLAELAPPSPLPPAHQHQAGLLPGRAGDEPIRVGAREPESLSRAGLDRVLPRVPGSGWAQGGPQRLLLQRSPLSNAAWDKARADLLSVVLQVERDWGNWNSVGQTLNCSFLVLIWLGAMLYGCCMPACTAVSWIVCVCSLIPLHVFE